MKAFVYYLILIFCAIKSYGQDSKNKVYYYDSDSITWDNLKGTPNFSDTLQECFLSSTFELKLLKVNVWTGKSTFQGYAIAFPYDSWIKENCKNDRNHKYLQTIYDLAHLYSKRLEKQFNKKYNPAMGILERQINEAIDKYSKDFNNEIETYNQETVYGRNELKINEWRERIRNELKVIDKK